MAKYKWWQYALMPFLGLQDLQRKVDNFVGANAQQTEHGEPIEQYNPIAISQNPSDSISDLKPIIEKLYKDFTGESAIELQNKLQRELAEEEYQRNIQSIGDTASAYEAAGFNRNLLYGSSGSPVSYSAPALQAYSGTQKLDRILQKTGQVLGLIPAMYQATAALEGIDQARERTKQSEIKTMSMGMSLLDQGYKLGDIQITHPFSPNLERDWFSTKRHFRDMTEQDSRLPIYKFGNQYSQYADAALKNKMDLLASIGIKNELNSTLNNWRGYQYSLDQRFGATGRIVGMAAQGANAAANLYKPIKLAKSLSGR